MSPIVDAIVNHRVDVLRYGEDVRRQILGLIDVLSGDLRNQITESDPGSALPSQQQALQRKLFARLKTTITTSYQMADTVLEEGMRSAAEVENDFGLSIVQKLVPDAEVRALTPKDLEALIQNALVHGAPAKAWWSKEATDLNLGVQQQVRLGMVAGEGTGTLLQRVIGKRSGKNAVVGSGPTKRSVVEYVGGVFDRAKRGATTLVKTAIHAATNLVMGRLFQENHEVVGGQQWLSVLDHRTTIQCAALDGTVWDLEGNHLKGSRTALDFPGHPPIHMNCRSIMIPLRHDQESVNTFTYEAWLRNQPVGVQQDVLGVGKWRLWKSGQLTLPEIVDQSMRPLTLKEFQSRLKR